MLVTIAHFGKYSQLETGWNFQSYVSERDRFKRVYTASCKLFSVGFFIVSQMSSLHNATGG